MKSPAVTRGRLLDLLEHHELLGERETERANEEVQVLMLKQSFEPKLEVPCGRSARQHGGCCFETR